MIRTTTVAIVALAAAHVVPAAVQARAAQARAVVATWHPAMGPEGRYCVRSTHLETAAMTGTRIYQRACRSERDWRAMGVTFARAPRRG